MTAFWKDICPVEAYWNGVLVGPTEGDARFRLTTEYVKSQRTKTGSMAHNEYVSGRTLEFETPVTQPTLEQLAALIPGAVLTAGPGSKALQIKSSIGTSMRDIAQELILKPIINGVATTDEKQWIKAALAAPKMDADVALGFTQGTYKVLWAVYDNETTGLLATLGKDAVTT